MRHNWRLLRCFCLTRQRIKAKDILDMKRVWQPLDRVVHSVIYDNFRYNKELFYWCWGRRHNKKWVDYSFINE
jgi:hypothetical protein